MRTSVLGGFIVALLALSGDAAACGDTVSATVCMVNDFVWGPHGVVPFAQGMAAWAEGWAREVVFGIIVPGGWL